MDWFEDAMQDEYRNDGDDDSDECPICGDDAGWSCPCVRDD